MIIKRTHSEDYYHRITVCFDDSSKIYDHFKFYGFPEKDFVTTVYPDRKVDMYKIDPRYDMNPVDSHFGIGKSMPMSVPFNSEESISKIQKIVLEMDSPILSQLLEDFLKDQFSKVSQIVELVRITEIKY